MNYNDAIYEIQTALGDYADDFDIDGIFRDCYQYSADRDGFVRVVDDDEFWKVAQRHDNTAKD